MGRWLRGHTGWAGMMREDRPKEPAWWTTREDLKTQWTLGATREIRLSGGRTDALLSVDNCIWLSPTKSVPWYSVNLPKHWKQKKKKKKILSENIFKKRERKCCGCTSSGREGRRFRGAHGAATKCGETQHFPEEKPFPAVGVAAVVLVLIPHPLLYLTPSFSDFFILLLHLYLIYNN